MFPAVTWPAVSLNPRSFDRRLVALATVYNQIRLYSYLKLVLSVYCNHCKSLWTQESAECAKHEIIPLKVLLNRLRGLRLATVTVWVFVCVSADDSPPTPPPCNLTGAYLARTCCCCCCYCAPYLPLTHLALNKWMWWETKRWLVCDWSNAKFYRWSGFESTDGVKDVFYFTEYG